MIKKTGQVMLIGFVLLFGGISALMSISDTFNSVWGPGWIFRKKSYCGAPKTDLATLANAQDSYYAEHNTYTLKTSTLEGWGPSRDVTVKIKKADKKSWVATASHPKCKDGDVFVWDSVKGGLQ